MQESMSAIYGYVRVLDNFNPNVRLGELPCDEQSTLLTAKLEQVLHPLQQKSFLVDEYTCGLYPYNLARGDCEYNHGQNTVTISLI